MHESATESSLRRWALLAGIALPLLGLIVLGQDRNWDLQNYHLYNAFAWLHGRLSTDIAPAQLQSWHNPLLDVPMYAMNAAGWPGFAVGLWLALPSMLALWFLLRLYLALATQPPTRARLLALAVLAASGAAACAELGTTFDDAFVAAGILGSVFVLVRDPSDAERLVPWFMAGVIAGATAGLKLTADVYCIGLAGAALAWPGWRRAPLRLATLLSGGVLGLALTFGYWAALVLHLHGNPVFPYHNEIFHSADAAAVANTDLRFRPASLLDALLVPLRLLTTTQRYSEIELRDPRLLAGFVGFAALLWKMGRARASEDVPCVARVRALAAFFVVSFAAWAWQYGVYRYVLPLEMLACLGALLALEGLPSRWRTPAVSLACALLVSTTLHPSWGRSRFGPSFVQVVVPRLPVRSMVVLGGASPLAYAVTALPDDVPAISFENNFMRPDLCTDLQESAQARIANHAGPLWLLRGGDPADDAEQADAKRYYGLSVSGRCLPVSSNLGDLRLCRLSRIPQALPCASRARAPGR
jgi:hypothetical protein